MVQTTTSDTNDNTKHDVVNSKNKPQQYLEEENRKLKTNKKSKQDGDGDVEMATEEGEEEEEEETTKNKNLFSLEYLKVYYSRVFPFDEYYKWLSYGLPDEKNYMGRREFSFNIDKDGSDIYTRYRSYQTKEELTAAIKKINPHKIDIGAIYNISPKDHKTVQSKVIKPEERELVFDIDLTDYDEVRFGCTEDMMWENGSWQYMSVAMKVVDRTLREDFGFEHIFWVFSGRRGVHCWVCDSRARLLEDRERTSIVNYLTLIVGSEKNSNRIPLSTPIHPSIKRALPFLEKTFYEMVLSPEGQDIFKKPENWDKILNNIPSTRIQERLRQTWEKEKTPTSSLIKWKQLKATVLDEAKNNKKSADGLKKCLIQIVILFTYPRLDVNVSTHRNHLLKSPFVVHPKTGKVCVPILDVENSDQFDPDGVPTLPSLIEEINSISPEEQSDPAFKVYEKTSMKPYIEGFDTKFLKPLYKTILREQRIEKEQQNPMDW